MVEHITIMFQYLKIEIYFIGKKYYLLVPTIQIDYL